MGNCNGCVDAAWGKRLWERQQVIMSRINYMSALMIEAKYAGDTSASEIFDKQRKALNEHLRILSGAGL